MSEIADIEVWVQWEGMNEASRVGFLHSEETRGGELISFEYDAWWLKQKNNHLLDPYLQFFKGKFFPRSGEESFSLFLDSAPGEWGKLLHNKYEGVLARRNKRETRRLRTSDYLIGVFDYYRQGALRFRIPGAEDFVTGDEQFFLPTFASLKELERASLVCANNSSAEKELTPAIDAIIYPGGALGGKRPKANVIDDEWQMWLAKFPAANDETDVGGWEFVANTLAGLAGIQTPNALLKKGTGPHHTFLSQRFDRNLKGERIHYASAMTMLGYGDTTHTVSRASYLNIAEFIMRHGSNVNRDLEELWRRIVFNIAITNTDDHLRNHGFLLGANGWELAPAFDLNPGSGESLSLNISEHDSTRNFELALSVAPYFRVEAVRAKSILNVVKVAVGQWRKVAVDAGIVKSEIEKMGDAFHS
jgi:serine/threonine-protein kinase HipA